MTRRSTVDVAVVGLGFGEDFLPVYRAHPGVGEIAVVDASPERLDAVAGRHSITHRYTAFHEMLLDDRWQAVHVLAPVRFHADYSVAALEAGRHVACAVPMATELADVDRVVAAQRESGTTYTMMETAVYGREFRFVQQLADDGRLGALTMYRGFHLQNLDGYPEYWRGYPPMKYATHALAPLLALTGSQVATVTALGSGTLTPERIGAYDNPFPAQTGVFRLTDSDVSAVLSCRSSRPRGRTSRASTPTATAAASSGRCRTATRCGCTTCSRSPTTCPTPACAGGARRSSSCTPRTVRATCPRSWCRTCRRS